MNIAFDVDDCLIVPSVATGLPDDTPNYETIGIYFWLKQQGNTMYIWSGSGIDWASRWNEKLGLGAQVIVKEKRGDIDIAFDDCDVDLATVNVKVKRIQNAISRKRWNTEKR